MNSTPEEDVYTVASVMAKINKEVYGERKVASIGLSEPLPPEHLVRDLPGILERLVHVSGFKEDMKWKLYLEACLRREIKYCFQLVERWSSFAKDDFIGAPINPLFQEVTIHLVLFACYLESQQYFAQNKNGEFNCSRYRYIAEKMEVESDLAQQFYYYCAEDNELACIEQLYYMHKTGLHKTGLHKTGSTTRTSETTLYRFCQLGHLGACQLWLEYYSHEGSQTHRESVQMRACLLGGYKECEHLMHKGSVLYAERATHYLIQSCINENKNCEALASLVSLNKLQDQKMPILSELCRQGYARYCHHLVIEESKKYGILVAKSHLKTRCQLYFRRAGSSCSLSQSLECKDFHKLCEEYQVNSVQFSHR